MTAPEPRAPARAIRRILVAVDASPHSLAALAETIDLAARLHAEILGLFVEDADLLRLAELPIAHEVGAATAIVRPVDRVAVERQLRARARRVEAQLARLAAPARIRWSFRVARGAVAPELLAAAHDIDLITLGRAGWSPFGRRQLGSVLRLLAAEAPRPVMVLRARAGIATPAVLVYDGSPAARAALTLAADVVHGRDGELRVLVAADDAATADRLAAEVAGLLVALQRHPSVLRLAPVTVGALARAADQLRAGTLVLPADHALVAEGNLARLLEAVRCPLLLVR